MAITTVEKVAEYIGITSDDDVYGQLSTMLTSAQRRAESFCGYEFDSATYTEYYDISQVRSGVIYTRHRPITSLLTITDDAQVSPRAISTSNDVQWDYTDWKNVGRMELWNTEGSFTGDKRAVKVVYTAGWTVATAPADLVEAINMMVAARWEGTEALTRRSQNIGGEQIDWLNEDIPPQAQAILSAYASYWVV